MTKPERMTLGQRMKFLAKDTAIYGMGGAVNKALALITFPLLARHFSVQDYGLIDLLNTLMVLAVTLLVFGQDSAVARYFYEDADNEYRRQVVSQSLAFQVATLLTVLPILWLSADPIASNISASREGGTILRLMILQAPFFLLINFSQGILKWTFDRWRFLFISVGSTVFTLACLVFGLTLGQLSVVEVFVVYLVTRALFGLIGLWFVRKWLTIPAGMDRLKELLPFAIPLGIICAMSAVLPVLERSITTSLLGARELGLFAAGAKVSSLIGLPINAFEIAWGPFALSIFKEDNASASYRLVLKVGVALMFCVVMALAAIAEPMVVALGSARYEGAGVVVFALSLGLAMQAIGSITGVGIVFSKKSYLLLYGYGAMLLVSALAIPLLALGFGLVGVAWGSMFAMVARTVVEAWLAQRAHPIAWDYSGPAVLGAATLAVGLLHQATYGSLQAWGVSLAPLAGIFLLLAISWFALFDAAGRGGLVTALRAVRIG